MKTNTKGNIFFEPSGKINSLSSQKSASVSATTISILPPISHLNNIIHPTSVPYFTTMRTPCPSSYEYDKESETDTEASWEEVDDVPWYSETISHRCSDRRFSNHRWYSSWELYVWYRWGSNWDSTCVRRYNCRRCWNAEPVSRKDDRRSFRLSRTVNR